MRTFTPAPEEKIAREWIKNNPHVALIIAFVAHERLWHHCECPLRALGASEKFLTAYAPSIEAERGKHV